VECAWRKRLDKTKSETQSACSDIVSNKTRDLQQYRQTSNTVNDTADRQVNNPHTGNENTTLNTGEQAKNMYETDTEQVRQMNTGISSTLETEDPAMDTQETPTGLNKVTEQGEESDAAIIQTYGKEIRDYPVDRATGGTKTEKTLHSSPEGETGGAERHSTYENSRDGANSTAIFQTTSSRPKKLKTEGDDPTLRTRNSSKTRFKNLTK